MQQEKTWRYGRVRRALADADLDGLLVYAPGWRRENVRYLTGAPFRGAFAFVYLPVSGEPTAFVSTPEDGMAFQAQGWVTDVRPLDMDSLSELRARLQAGGRPSRLGIAPLELLPGRALAALEGALGGTELVSASKLMDRLRMVKSSWELEQIRHGARICEQGWQSFVSALRPGVREYEIVAAVEYELKRQGAEDNFMIIASGGKEVRGMTPPSDRALEPGDLVRTELTPQYQGYWAQICRSAVLGEPSREHQESFKLFHESLEAGLSVCKAGVTAHEVAVAVNDVFRRYGYGEYTTSRYTRVRGHGHGLFLDEPPTILEGVETVLEENTVLIVHPNTFTPLAGYMVLGDPIVITRTGYEPLLTTERKLFVA